MKLGSTRCLKMSGAIDWISSILGVGPTRVALVPRRAQPGGHRHAAAGGARLRARLRARGLHHLDATGRDGAFHPRNPRDKSSIGGDKKVCTAPFGSEAVYSFSASVGVSTTDHTKTV